MTVQTSYEKNINTIIAGLIYDMGFTDVDSFSAEVAIEHGIFVSRGTDPERQVAVGGAAAIGVSVRTASENDYKPATLEPNGQYAINETVGVLRAGYIWTQFNAIGGTVGAVVTINAAGLVVAAGGGTALTGITARIEKAAVLTTFQGVTANLPVGLIHVGLN